MTKIIDRKTFLPLAIILGIGVALRVLAAMLIGSAHVPWELEFEEIARNLVTHGTYSFSFYGLSPLQPSSFIPPVYPLFLASARLLWPSNGAWLVKVIQILISEFSIMGLYALTREMGGSTRQGILAALLWAVYPPTIAYASDLSTVTLEIFFLIFGIWLIFRSVNLNSPGLAIPAGILLSLAALTRPTWLLVLPLIAVWLTWYLKGKWRVWGRAMLFFGLAACFTLLPWVIYNYKVQGRLLVTSTNGGLNFWIGNNPHATGEYVFPTELDQKLVLGVVGWSEIARDQFFYAQGLDFIRKSPGEFVSLLGRKLIYAIFFRPNIGSVYETAHITLYNLAIASFVVVWLALIPFALVGLFSLGTFWRVHTLLVVVFLGNVATSALYFSGTRFRTPVDGFVVIWAAIGLTALFGKWQQRKSLRSVGSIPGK